MLPSRIRTSFSSGLPTLGRFFDCASLAERCFTQNDSDQDGEFSPAL